jgi:hypothetical protein
MAEGDKEKSAETQGIIPESVNVQESKQGEVPAEVGVNAIEGEKQVETESGQVPENILPEEATPPEPTDLAQASQVGVSATGQLPEKDLLSQDIQDILEEDITDLFLNMPPDKQQLFQQKGEETVSKIKELVSATKVQVRKVVELIRDWLKMIPGVNMFYIEQESKIKTDKILDRVEEQREEGNTL